MPVVEGRSLSARQTRVLRELQWRWQVYRYESTGPGMLVSMNTMATVEALARRGLLRLKDRRVWLPDV